jgi:hypothetical protein
MVLLKVLSDMPHWIFTYLVKGDMRGLSDSIHKHGETLNYSWIELAAINRYGGYEGS